MRRMRGIVPLVPALCLAVAYIAGGRSLLAQQFITAKPLVLVHQSQTGTVLAIADFNKDGRQDVLAVTDLGLVALIQKNDGSFGTELVGPPASQGAAYRVADMNGDGVPDIALTVVPQPDPNGHITGTTKLHILLGNADGSFRRGFTAALATHDFYSIAIDDFNRDGRNDVALTQQFGSGPQTLAVFLNEGGDAFRALKPVRLNLQNGLLSAGDFDEDGRIDLVFSTTNLTATRSGIQILSGNGDGTFTPGAKYELADSRYIIDIFEASPVDLNGDGHLDLVVLSEAYSNVLLGKGDGTFKRGPIVATSLYGSAPPPPVGDIGFLVRPAGIRIADFNRDGIPDLAVLNVVSPSAPSAAATVSDSSVIAVFPGRGDGTFRDPRVYTGGNGGFSFGTGDMNGDGNLDFSLGNQPSGGAPLYPAFSVLFGDHNGNFRGPVSTPSFSPTSAAVGDFNGDHIPDVAVVNLGFCVKCAGTVSVFLGSGKGYFKLAGKYPIKMLYGNVAAGDVNRDGKIDLVVTRSQLPFQPGSATSTSGDTAVLLGRGDGTFAPARNSVLLGSANVSLNGSTYLLDVNNDKRLDLIGDWGVALGDGDGTFKPPIAFPGLGSIVSISPGHFNHDGNLDLAVLQSTDIFGEYDPLVFSLLGNGDGSFRISQVIGGSKPFIGAMGLADLNRDGIPDLLMTSLEQYCNCSPTLGVQFGKGDGTFGNAVSYNIPDLGISIVTADFDRDGFTDVLLLGSSQGVASNGGLLLHGMRNGTLQVPAHYPGPLNSLSPAFAIDLNGDGAPDVAGITAIGIERILNTGTRIRVKQ
jgi:hypothetical protein